MKSDVFKIILLLGLPASGKSEVREFIRYSNANNLLDLHIGDSIQLDDFPYVHLFKLIDQGLNDLKMANLFYSDKGTFIDNRQWLTLVNLLNDDYNDLISKNYVNEENACEYIFNRIDKARNKVGMDECLTSLDTDVKNYLYSKLNEYVSNIVANKNSQLDYDLNDKTVVIEMSRGGRENEIMPIKEYKGYQNSLSVLDEKILNDASVLYVYVSPQESRRKNIARANPNDPGSNLHHGVNMNVMLEDYGCDDLLYLKEISDKENTICVNKEGKKYYLPVGIFDNRVDLTTFLREDSSKWSSEDVNKVSIAIKKATDTIYDTKRKLEEENVK